MSLRYLNQMVTPSVNAAQNQFFGRHQELPDTSTADQLGTEEIEHIEARDSFYMATINEHDWPYLQHRGGAAGFLKVLSPTQLGFADYRGNRQLLSTGNLAHNDRISLFLMDYPSKSRLKILGHAHVLHPGEDPTLTQRLVDPPMAPRVERLFLIDVDSYDWNCSQYITPRFTSAQVSTSLDPLKSRIAELDDELRRLRSRN
jgi:predicted pyridoxine 5'-phosphate oxidase superfamily flavin-nucleotide-binding protein